MMNGGQLSTAAMAAQICNQIQSVFSCAHPALPPPLDVLVAEVFAAATARRRIFIHGVGREGLMLKAFFMRLKHLDLSIHVVGEMAPPVTSHDLLLASAGPGGFSTLDAICGRNVDAICGVVKSVGARVVLITAQPGSGSSASFSPDAVVYIPAKTMADEDEEGGGGTGTVRLPMGSLYEVAMLVLFEMAVLRLAEMLKQTPA